MSGEIGVDSGELNSSVHLTVIFLLYNAASTVGRLLDAVLAQTHPRFARQQDWLRILFVDDCSPDNTTVRLQEALDAARQQLGQELLSHVRILRNPENLGLSKTLNKAFQSLTTRYGLTCHDDCFFGRPDYVAQMLELMESHPGAGVITGQPAIRPGERIPIAEAFNLTENLMDIFPRPIPKGNSEAEWLEPVGFAEGRCDIFRVAALEAAGWYDTTLRLSGEDQLLCARMRQKGFGIFQAPGLEYFLSVSASQDTVFKLLIHHHLLARTSPYVLLKNRETLRGIIGGEAGGNRTTRTLLRLHQLAATATYAACLVLWTTWELAWIGGAALLVLFFLKLALFWKHMRKIRFSFLEGLGFALLQIPFDVIYAIGFAQGLWNVVTRRKKGMIH